MAAPALATTYIYEGRGVGSTRINQDGDYIAAKLSTYRRKTKDTRYSYLVWHWYVGRKMSNGRYPIELYARSNERVYRYQINSSTYPTTKGIKVGSYESALRSKYTNESGPYTSGLYRRYTIRHKYWTFYTYTDFYCRGGKVNYIIIRR